MTVGSRKFFFECLQVMLKPVVRFCLRHSLHVQDLLEAAKQMFIEVAQEEAEAKQEPVNISRLSAMTGMHRRDVMRIYRDEGIKKKPEGLITRIIGQWRQAPEFTTPSGKPRVLTYENDDSEFSDLVRSVTNDIHSGTVLFELERVGAVERTRNGLKLVSRAYVPKGNLKEGLTILAEDTEDLTNTVFENIFSEPEVPNLHAKTYFDNIAVEDVPQIREWLLREGSALHQRARNFLSKYDLDINKKQKKSGGGRVVLGTFGFAYGEGDSGDSSGS